jgi:hypothetical protein
MLKPDDKALKDLVNLLQEPDLKIYYNRTKRTYGFSFPNTNIIKYLEALNTLNIKYTINEKYTADTHSYLYIHSDNIQIIDNLTNSYIGKLYNYGTKLHLARYPMETLKYVKQTHDSIHFMPMNIHNISLRDIFQDDELITAAPSKSYSICVSDSEGLHASLVDCLKDTYALETKYKNKYNYKYLKYKIKYLNLKLLNK